MIEVYPNLYIGGRYDYESVVSGQSGWAIVHACKQYHRSAVGYKLWNVSRHHPEYLLARRENRIMLCLLDLPVSRFIKKEMIDQTLDFIDEVYSSNSGVYIQSIIRIEVFGNIYVAIGTSIARMDKYDISISGEGKPCDTSPLIYTISLKCSGGACPRQALLRQITYTRQYLQAFATPGVAWDNSWDLE